ncbi:MAG TPA: FAD-binding oxidoreductase, partial [Candidatus Limnocylindria bacterium]|nr:FAD-binding oxidoreductase [Candidatus Limnocylindria bacterium]
MEAFSLNGIDGEPRSIPTDAFGRFTDDLKGSVLRPDDAGYAEAIALWNGMITKRPGAVVRASGTDDVIRTVSFARDNEVELSIKGAGHNIAGLALTDGGITLDMSGFKGVEVDVDGRRARVAAGSTLGEVDAATQAHGLATTLGFVSATGVSGLTLGGGFGYLSRRFGWTIDDLEEVEIVTADGALRRASATENEDLFWALRGGGGNFGVATQFTYRLHEVGPQITAGIIAWPASEADAVTEVFRSTTDAAPRELTLVMVRRNAPPAPWLPESAHGTPIVMVLACHTGADAERDLAPLRSIGTPLADLIQVKSYTDQQMLLDATQPRGMHYYWKSEFVPGPSDDLLATYHAQFEGLKAPANQAVLFQVAGALNERPE